MPVAALLLVPRFAFPVAAGFAVPVAVLACLACPPVDASSFALSFAVGLSSGRLPAEATVSCRLTADTWLLGSTCAKLLLASVADCVMLLSAAWLVEGAFRSGKGAVGCMAGAELGAEGATCGLLAAAGGPACGVLTAAEGGPCGVLATVKGVPAEGLAAVNTPPCGVFAAWVPEEPEGPCLWEV